MSAKFTRPYVDAFFAVAKDPGAELAALEAFRTAYDAAPELEKVLSNPGLEREKREAILGRGRGPHRRSRDRGRAS